MRKKIVALILTVAMLVSFVPFTLTAGASSTVNDGVAGYLMDVPEEECFVTYNNKYVNYGTRLFMKKDQDPFSHTASYGQGNGSGVYIRKSGNEYFTILNPQESYDADNKLKEANGGLYYNTISGRGLAEDGGAKAGMPSGIDASTITHIAIRFKVTGGEADQYSSVSLSHNNSSFISLSSAYLIDSVSGEIIDPNFTSHRLAITGEFDGWLVISYTSLSDTIKTTLSSTGKAIYPYFHSELCSLSTHGPDTRSNWTNKVLWLGDIALVDNEANFKKIYGTPNFEVASNDTSITVISDDADAIYSFDKNAEAAKWMTKEQFNAAAKDLPRGTKYTVYAKYATGTRIASKEIATTNTGIAGYLMQVPQEDTYLTYNSKYIGWGSETIVKTSGADPFSNSGYASGGSQGLFVRKPEGSNEHFIVFNLKDTPNETTGLIPEGNVGLNWNTISGRGLNVAEDGTTTVKTGMPEYINKDSLKAVAMRIKISGGTADQYSSVSFYLSGIKDYLQMSRGYLIDNTTGLVMNPYFQSNASGQWFNLKGEFDGWLVLPYEYIFAGHRQYLETTGGSIALYFHTNSCNNSNHGKDSASDWTNKIFWLGHIALVDDEDAFINAHSRPITDSEGMVFTSNDYHTIDGTFTKMTNTFEAWVKFPQNYPKNIRGGVMLSNSGNARNSITYQILANGKPSVSTTKYSYGTSKGSETRTFDQVNVYNGEWTHLAIVNDQANNTITCYVNGVAAQTLEGALADSINTVAAGVLGGNFSPGNVLAFRGEMKEVALYSDVRTADEIKADMNAAGADDLMAHWDLSKDAVNGKIIDESGNNHDVTLGKVWFDSDVDPDDYDYSFAIVGDTQYVNYNWNDRYDDIYDWLVENKDTKKIKYVMNMGDITENSADAQWERAATEHAKLDAAKIPYSLVRGNHDKSAGFNTAFNKAPYINSYAESYDEKIENTYRELTVGNIKYLIFTLDIGASDEVLEWAGNIVEAHPYHNVIFTTHVYLDKNGVPMNSSYNGASTNSTYGGGGNDADEMWDKLFGKYENVVMVLCGHVSAETAVRTERIGVNGNVVTQMLIDPQGTDNSIGATGMVTMLNFSNNGKNINVETYSTVREKHYKTQGQYDFTLPVIKYPAAFQSASLTLDNSTAVNFKANAENLADFSNIYATFDLEGVDGSVKVNASQPDDKGMLVFTFDDIPAEMMGNTITATIHATKDGKEHTTSTTYSVEQYCYNKLEKYAPYVEGSEYSEEDIEYATSFKTLIVDLLNYGSAVQSYTGTDAENLVNGDLTESEKAFANAHVPEMNGLRAIYNNLENETIRWSAGNLVFHNNVQLKFNFKFVDGKTADTSNYKVVIANDLEGTDVIATIGATEFKSEDGEYVVYYKGFDATEMDRNIYMTVFDGSTQVSDTFAYSISAYARQKYTPDDATNALSNAVLAMMRYGDAAEAHEIWRGYVA